MLQHGLQRPKSSYCLSGLVDLNSDNVCPCACRKRRLIMGRELSYTTGLLHAWPSFMQSSVCVWTVDLWVVLVQVIYCFKSDEFFFLTSEWHPWGEILSYSYSRKPDLPVTHSSPFSTWVSVLFFFSSTAKTTLSGQGYMFCLVVVATLPSQLPYPYHLLCVVW